MNARCKVWQARQIQQPLLVRRLRSGRPMTRKQTFPPPSYIDGVSTVTLIVRASDGFLMTNLLPVAGPLSGTLFYFT